MVGNALLGLGANGALLLGSYSIARHGFKQPSGLSVVLATAYSDPSKPKGTGKDEAVIWASTYGKGRVFENVLGHDVATINDPGFQSWTRRGVIWAATGKVPDDVK